MKHLGDISKIHGAHIEPVDLITFGSPCQDLSVAGKRAGLKHETNGDEETTRSGLFMEAVRIIKEMREATNGKYPRFALWENVPGAFSSNKGEDFRVVLEELIKIVEEDAAMPAVPKAGWAYADSYSGHGWSLAYRVLDAQHWGVPQRRRRIFLVADFGGERAEEILFERESLRGHFAQGQQTWQGAAANAESGSGAENSQGKCYGISSYASNAMLSDNPHSGIYEAETSRTLDLNGGNPACNQGGVAIVESVAYESHPADSRVRLVETAAPTLTAKFAKLGSDGVIVCAATQQGGAEIREDDKAPTITAAAGMSGNNQPFIAFAQNQRDEVRELGDVAGALQAQLGMKQQTFIIDSIGGQAEAARETDVAPTLKASHYKFPPVYAGGFCPEMSAKTRTVGYQDETSPTLRAGATPACAYGFQRQLSGVEAQPDMSPTILAAAGESGNNQPCVVYDTRGNGNGDTAATVTGDHENRITDYTNVVCAPEAISLLGDKVSGTLKARDYKGVGRQDSLGSAVCVFDKEVYNSGVNATGGHYIAEDGPAPTLRASVPPGISTEYIVRRLTPIECARLQGFPDNWGALGEKESFTEEEYRFWLEVRNTHAAINGKQVKDYTEAQMLRWYNKLHTDSAEYKMWGNGIALPCALYVMQGIADVLTGERAS